MNILRSGTLAHAKGVCHGFFGRQGGVSHGVFTSLNCGPGSGDDKACVAENRDRVAAALAAGAKLVTLSQVHSATAFAVEQPWAMGEGAEGDAMATNVPGIALGILTADCAPVLFADEGAGVIGAAHAGWKGAFSGVLESALAAMEKLGAKRARITAAIGPNISQTNYEVGPEFRARFVEADESDARFFTRPTEDGHCRFDLTGYARQRLERAGVGKIDILDVCTYGADGDFFSFRRTTHRAEKDYGRQVSAIVLTP